MGQAQQRPVRLLDQIDFDQARPRRHILAAVPAKAVGQAVHRHDLAERAAGEARPGDIDEIKPAGLRLDLRLRPHPTQDFFGIGQQRENRSKRRGDVRLAADGQRILHRSSAGWRWGWAGTRPFGPAEIDRLRQAARFAAAPLAALSARAAMAALLEAYLGRRSAARVQTGAVRRGAGETIRAALLCADLRDFTALSEATEPAAVIAALDAWFDRVAGAVHAFGGEVLKFIGDGVLAIFPVTGAPADACEAALRALVAARAGMAHLDMGRQAPGPPAE